MATIGWCGGSNAAPDIVHLRPSIDEPPLNRTAPQASARMLLEIWINGQPSGIVADVERRTGGLFVPARELDAARLRLPDGAGPDDKLVDLAVWNGMRANVDDSDQRLLLTVDASDLQANVLDLRPA